MGLRLLSHAASPGDRRRHRHHVRLVLRGKKGRQSSDGGASAVLRVEVGRRGVSGRSAYLPPPLFLQPLQSFEFSTIATASRAYQSYS